MTTAAFELKVSKGNTHRVLAVPAASLEQACERASQDGWKVLGQAESKPRTTTGFLASASRAEVVNAIAWGVVKGMVVWLGICVALGVVLGMVMLATGIR